MHTLRQSILWHLLPGILGGITYFTIVGWVNEQGFPSIMALIISSALVLTPFQFGVLLYQRRKTGRKLFGEVVRYFKPLKFREYLFWVFIIVLATGLIMGASGPLNAFLQTRLFAWIPGEYVLNMGLEEAYSRRTLIITYTLVFLFVVLIGPTVEEFYFRGYLLPRIPEGMKKWTPLFHTTLFAVYHLWTPWMVVSRLFGVLPLTLVVMRKRNLYLGIIAHCLMNSIDFFIGLAFIIRLG